MKKAFFALVGMLFTFYCLGQLNVKGLQQVEKPSHRQPAELWKLPSKNLTFPISGTTSGSSYEFCLVSTYSTVTKNLFDESRLLGNFGRNPQLQGDAALRNFHGINPLLLRNLGYENANRNRITLHLPTRFDNLIRVEYFTTQDGRRFPVFTRLGEQTANRCFHCYCCPPHRQLRSTSGRNNFNPQNLILDLGIFLIDNIFNNLISSFDNDTYIPDFQYR